MGQAAEIYAEELSESLSLGYPLWFPDGVEIGDVGFIINGRFRRLFNITVPAEDPWNRTHGVPEGFVPLLLPDYFKTTQENYLRPGLFGSRSVKTAEVDSQLSRWVDLPFSRCLVLRKRKY